MNNNKTRNYVFTINNFTNLDKEQLRELEPRCTYLGYAEEHTLPGTGTPHLQGSLTLRNATTIRGLSRIVRRAAFLPMRGTPKQARDYYANPSLPKPPALGLYEYGTCPMDRQQQAEDQSAKFANAITLARAGKLDEIEPELLVRYYATWQKMAKQGASKPPNLEGNAKCIWIWGPTGTGKSHAVRTRFPNAYLKQANKWWDGYDGEEVVYLEDIDPEFAKWGGRFLKVWADKWTFPGEVKGSTGVFRPEAIIITSNYSIDQMGFRHEDTEALKRRFTEIYKISEEDEVEWAELGFGGELVIPEEQEAEEELVII